MWKKMFLILLVICLLVGVAQAQNKPGKPKISWEKKYDDAVKNAQSDGKPVLIFSTCDA
ncbi:MAG: hypothetical protein HY811_06110 [Planctomycetes bacterium]|nr:hypothetical protein [Planctomycetota bacterium]